MINREIISEIRKWLLKEKILILKGPRQVGKTTIIKNLQKELTDKGFKTIYFSADREIGNAIFDNPKLFIKYIKDQFKLDKNNKIFIFIDEFQYIKQAGIFLKVLFDEFKEEIQFIVSGSSSLEITKNSEYLTGRKIDFDIDFINFFEYLNYKSNNIYKKINLKDEDVNDFIKIYKDDIIINLLDYINYGGYPEICVTNNVSEKKTILSEIIETYIKKDIVNFLKIENVGAFNNLIKILCYQSGNLLNKSEITNTLNINHETVTRYLDILEGTYIFDYIKPYFTNIRKEISKMPKIYVSDLGILNYISKTYFDSLNDIHGNIIENYIYLQLKYDHKRENINYYRTISKSEIDFIISKDAELIPIEVKFRNKTSGMPLSINNFESIYKNTKTKILITKDYFKIDTNNYYIPFYLLPFINKSSF